jgi:poly-gamma-glutamate synthesis protein (capsule biosynthesis protein)
VSRTERSPINLALPVVVTALVVAGVTGVAAQNGPKVGARAAVSVPSATGTIVDETGRPVPNAVVRSGASKVTADANGRFSLPLRVPTLATATAAGHLPRTLALEPTVSVSVVLTSKAEETLSLRFGGDVMMGRRFYEKQDGEKKSLLKPSSSAKEHASILDGVEPLLKDADLTAVNLETPLLEDPEVEPDGKRRKDVHPSKDLVIASATATAKGLALAGVDVVSLGNNHLFDGLGPGLKSTMKALDDAGIAHFGAGSNAAGAWLPAIVTKRGQTVAYLGCTTVDGRQTGVAYVAGPTAPGAAECEPTRLAAEVAKARKQADTVVVMIHGGVEYRRRQTPEVRELAQVAHGAGARLVVGSHPHVIGGIVAAGSDVFAESMGNLVFDQELWPTFPSALLRVDVRGGVPVAATLDPVVVDGYRPRPAVGRMADTVARISAGSVDGAGRLGSSGAWVALGSTPAKPPAKPPVTVDLEQGAVRRLARGWWYQPPPGQQPAPGQQPSPGQQDPQVRMGTDLLLGTGSFERMQIGGDSSRASLWSLGKYGSVTSDAACGSDDKGAGLLLARTPLSKRTAYASPDHRTPVASGQRLSLLANVRQASQGSRLQVHWFKNKEGRSSGVSSLELPPGSWAATACRQVRFDVTVPKGAIAAQVFVMLKPPAGGQTVRRLAVDDLALVDWAGTGRAGRRYDVLEVKRTGPVTFQTDERGAAPPGPLVSLGG